MKIAYIDLETTGLNPGQDQILEIGCVIDDLSRPDDQIRPTFNCYIRHELIVGDPIALAMNARIIQALAEPEKCTTRILSATETVFALNDFLLKYIGDSVTIGGKNVATFDLPFLYRLPDCRYQKIGQVKIRQRVVDPAILYMIPEDEYLPNLALCLERAGLNNHVTHCALDDATQVMRLVRNKRCRT